MTIIQYKTTLPNYASHTIDSETGEVQKVWVEAFPDGTVACLHNSQAVTLRHERVAKTIPEVLSQRGWTPLDTLDGHAEVQAALDANGA